MAHAWADISGGYYGNEELSQKMRVQATLQMKLFDIVEPGDDLYLGKKSGDSVAFALFGRIASLATTALNEYQKMPITVVPRYEATATVARYGNAVSWTGVREDLDRLDVEDTTVWALKENAAQTENSLIRTALVAGRSFRYAPLTASTYGFKTDGTSPGTSAAKLTRFHLNQIARKMQAYNVPTFDGTNYVAVLSTNAYWDLMDDTASQGFIDVAKYSSGGAEGILNGEIGKYGPFRFVVDNDILANGTSYGEAFFVGSEACKEILCYPTQLLANMNLYGGFGEEKAIAYAFMKAFKTVWIYSTHGQGTVLHYEADS